MKLMLIAATMLLAAPLSAQQLAPPAACSFDTAAHTDTLSLQFAVRALHANDDDPDPKITAAFGELLRGAFHPPPSFGGLFAPNSYFVSAGERRFSQVLGVARLTIQPSGSIALKWLLHLLDAETEQAVERSLPAGTDLDPLRQAMSAHGWRSAEVFQLVFVALTDNVNAKQGPILRVRVPMRRIDADSVTVTHTGSKAQAIQHLSRGYDKTENLKSPPWVIDELGRVTTRSPHLVIISSRGSTQDAISFSTARAGGCPVAYALPLHGLPVPR